MAEFEGREDVLLVGREDVGVVEEALDLGEGGVDGAVDVGGADIYLVGVKLRRQQALLLNQILPHLPAHQVVLTHATGRQFSVDQVRVRVLIVAQARSGSVSRYLEGVQQFGLGGHTHAQQS